MTALGLNRLRRAWRGEIARPLFSAEWHGIQLQDIAREMGLAPDAVASEHFYEALYRRWKTQGFSSDDGWVQAKRRIADLMDATLREFAPSMPRVLSAGAGLGLIEDHLLDAGWNVELQECQPESLSRFAEDPRTRVWVTPDLRELPDAAYGAILSISMVYALDEAAYLAFLRRCHRMLQPGGMLLVWDHDVRISVAPLRRLLTRGPRPLFWGWLRTPALHAAVAERAGFRVRRVRHFDHALQPIASGRRIAGVQGPFGRSLALELVFVKA